MVFCNRYFFECIASLQVCKDTRREKAPSNKTSALSESMNMDIWVVSVSN